jgi:hypothetical protein
MEGRFNCIIVRKVTSFFYPLSFLKLVSAKQWGEKHVRFSVRHKPNCLFASLNGNKIFIQINLHFGADRIFIYGYFLRYLINNWTSLKPSRWKHHVLSPPRTRASHTNPERIITKNNFLSKSYLVGTEAYYFNLSYRKNNFIRRNLNSTPIRIRKVHR